MRQLVCICSLVLLWTALAFAQQNDGGTIIPCGGCDPIPIMKDPGQMQPIPPMQPIPQMKPIPPMAPPQGSNVNRNANTKPKSTPSPKDCKDQASGLRQEYNQYDQQAAGATGDDYVAAEDKKAEIRRKLADLAQRCGGWGALNGNSSASAAGKGSGAAGGGSSDGGASGGGGSGSGSSSAPTAPHPIGGRTAVLLIYRPATANTGVRIPKGLPTTLVRDHIARQKLRTTWQQLQNVRPRRDTGAVAPAVSNGSSVRPAGASDIARYGLDSAAQLEREAAALNAYVLTLGRFLGAQQNADENAMRRQAATLMSFIETAIDAAYAAAAPRSVADRLILNQLERGNPRGAGWSDELPKPGKVSISDFPPEVREELKSSGLEKQGLAQLQQDLNTLRPGDLDSEVNALRTQVSSASGSAAATQTFPPGPPPPDLSALEQEHARALQLASSTGVVKPGSVSNTQVTK